MPMNTGQFQNLYTRRIDLAFFEGWEEVPEQWSRVYKDVDAKTNNRTTQIIAGTGSWEKSNENGNPTEQQFQLGPLVFTQFDIFKSEVVMSKEQIDDELYDEVVNMAKDSGHGGRNTVEDVAAQYLQELYSNALGTGYDGVSTFNDNHPNYGTNGGTQDNLTTGALNDSTLKQAIILFRKQKDENGKKISSIPNKLVVPQSLQFTAATVLQSALQAGTTNNDKNVLPNLELVVSDFWDAYTQVRWFIEGPQHQLNMIWRNRPTFDKYPVTNKNGSQSWLGYARFKPRAENWRHLVGSTGI
ncbi:Mu-like prophage major head subunit gpT family protein [Cohnella nanjingensis]|uniref:Mu-like prophage major head subunit gpT family protein n=1 Tax=Cohnella nanjingensis TaxID=1387779 RepID=A0A7X0VGQ3_9BACL|nr:Mu-like prophage major head subunit gpT family protein [Cohnella nanjingensis]MBB6672623.1 Mu-like prophage major head subunit gpT family protein [Cohnella nanjingensis]